MRRASVRGRRTIPCACDWRFEYAEFRYEELGSLVWSPVHRVASMSGSSLEREIFFLRDSCLIGYDCEE